jgi:hypothetical protein
MAFIASPDKKPRLKSAPDGEAIVPDKIKDALTDWHERLGTPECEIIDLAEQEELLATADQATGKKPDYKVKDGPKYDIKRGPLPQKPVHWTGSGVHEAHEQYYAALANLAYEHDLPGAFKSTYGRLPSMALGIAMLIASLENNNVMDMRHWARAQNITERWRASFHVLVDQLSNGHIGGYGALENAVIEVITKKLPQGQWFKPRDVIEKGGTFIRTAGSRKIREVLEELHANETLARDGVGKKAVFKFEGGKN